jgi:uncharacterized protein YdeI (YjbR/CyaY-like superfamily)
MAALLYFCSHHAMQKDSELYFIDGCGRCSLYATPACKVHTWAAELQLLRKIMISSGLTETMKWGCPCYVNEQNKNVAMMVAFKNHASISFFKGMLLQDPHKLLHTAGENSQSAKHFKFTNTQEIIDLEPIIQAYIQEAIQLEKEGAKIEFKQKHELEFPQELIHKFNEDPAFREAFLALTPGRQRGYNLHFTGAKQSATRTARIEKFVPKILKGMGFHD